MRFPIRGRLRIPSMNFTSNSLNSSFLFAIHSLKHPVSQKYTENDSQ
jgi:hypothetical protein